MKIVQITTDSREHFKQYDRPEPYFGTAPEGLLRGFSQIPGIEVHVISCSHAPTRAPAKIGPNIWFHQPVVGDWGWGRTLFAGCVKAARGIIRGIDPEIVHGQGTEKDCAMAAVLSGRPSVVTLHGNMRVHAARPEHRKSHYYRMVAMLEAFAVRRADGVLAIWGFTRDRISHEARDHVLIPNAVDPRYFDVQPSRREIPRLLFV